MGEVVHTIRLKVLQQKRPVRLAFLEEVAEPIRLGLHRGVKHLYKVPFEKDLPTTLDYIVAGVAG